MAYDEGPLTPESSDHAPPLGGIAPERWESLRAVLKGGPFEDANLPRAQAESARAELASLAKELVEIRERPERELAEERRAARVRVLVPSLLAAAILGALGYLVSHRDSFRPNLARGRSWKASSTLARCDPVHAWCGGGVTEIFFHTEEEESPWVEFDLGSRKWLRLVEVRNRLDCCQERAVPLVVEVSEDETTWAEVARKEETFAGWAARFPAKEARYVRLRVARKSILHLEEVAIR